MLRIYSVALTLASDAGNIAKVIANQDLDLARQLRRAATSIALNLAEGAAQQGGHRRQRYATAAGSAKEVSACFDVAIAMGYVESIDAEVRARTNQVVGTCINLAK